MLQILAGELEEGSRCISVKSQSTAQLGLDCPSEVCCLSGLECGRDIDFQSDPALNAAFPGDDGFPAGGPVCAPVKPVAAAGVWRRTVNRLLYQYSLKP